MNKSLLHSKLRCLYVQTALSLPSTKNIVELISDNSFTMISIVFVGAWVCCGREVCLFYHVLTTQDKRPLVSTVVYVCLNIWSTALVRGRQGCKYWLSGVTNWETAGGAHSPRLPTAKALSWPRVSVFVIVGKGECFNLLEFIKSSLGYVSFLFFYFS